MYSLLLLVFLLFDYSCNSLSSYVRRVGRLEPFSIGDYENTKSFPDSDGNTTFAEVKLRGDWPGSGIEFDVISSQKSIFSRVVYNKFVDNCNCKYFIKVFLDGSQFLSKEISNTAGFDVSVTLNVDPQASNAVYNLKFLKQSEAYCGDSTGVMEVVNVSLSGGSFTSTKSTGEKNTQQLNILFVGDSITCAYGVDQSMPCSFTASTENVFDGYAGIVSKHFNANPQFICWSGKGVVRNYGATRQISSSPMPVFYNRTIAQEAATFWDPIFFEADLVYLMLGTNDYSTEPAPADNIFIDGLVNLMKRITIDYPKSKLIVACAPMQTGNQCANIESGVIKYNNNRSNSADGASYLYLDPSLLDEGLGCDYHPNKASSQNIANIVISKINEVLSL